MTRLGMGLVVGCLLGPAMPARAGDLVGEIAFEGPAPVLPPLKVNKDGKVCGTSVEDQSVIVTEGHLKNVVVTARGEGLNPPAPVAAVFEVDQKACLYVPHVQAVPVGSTLELVNSDPVLHNVHGRDGMSTTFNLAMPVKGMRIPRPLSKPAVVHLRCDVHNFMDGYVLVVDAPFSVTGQDGRYAIRGLPAGTYEVKAWHERYGVKTATVTVPAAGEARSDFTYRD
jgi:plastocyanin